MEAVLSADLGTTKICAAAVDLQTGLPLAVFSAPNDADVPGLPQGWHEQDPARLLSVALDVLRSAAASARQAGAEVRALGISGQMHGCLLVDQTLAPVSSLITWRDRRTAEDAPGSLAESLALLPDGVQDRCGCRMSVGYGAAILRWLLVRGLVPRGAGALGAAGFLAACLTGVAAIDEGHAASWGICDLGSMSWDRGSSEALAVESLLPEIRLSGTVQGHLKSEIAEELGLGADVAVCSPVGDAQASFVGAAGFADDTATVNIGTGAQFCVPGQLEGRDETLDAWPLPGGGMLRVGACLCGGWAYAYLRQFYQQVAREVASVEVSDEQAYEAMNRLAEDAEPGTLAVDTRFGGTRQQPEIRGAFSGIDTVNLTAGNMARGVLRGIAGELAGLFEQSGGRVSRLVASGNAVRRSRLLRRELAGAFGMPLYVAREAEEAVRGAAYTAAVGAGLLSQERVTEIVREMQEPAGSEQDG